MGEARSREETKEEKAARKAAIKASRSGHVIVFSSRVLAMNYAVIVSRRFITLIGFSVRFGRGVYRRETRERKKGSRIAFKETAAVATVRASNPETATKRSVFRYSA